MIYDRPYYAKNPKRSENLFGGFFENMTAVKIIIAANVAFFALDMFLRRFMGSDVLDNYFALSYAALSQGKIWTLFTYSMLHDGILHIGVNSLVIYLSGRLLEERIGKARTLAVYALSVLGGALMFLFANLFEAKSVLLGASGGAVGILAAFLMMSRNERMEFIVVFFPVRLRAMAMLKIMAAFEFFGFIFFELAPYARGGIGFSAHLGGIAAGVLAAVAMSGGAKNLRMAKMPKFGFFKKRRGMGRASDYNFKIDLSTDAELRAEVDRILDKVGKFGFHTLSDAEKEVLNRAKDRLK
ncbi:MAG: rhomboid family intramembrane serine protease [Opitutales bacterium]|nr:rhomboid family intramembrane serine protease [Opitutales bacterium]